MRILLDEDLDVRLRRYFGADHEVVTVQYMGWKGYKNGQLLKAAAKEFDALVSMDDNLPEQQNLQSFDIAVVVLRGRSKDLDDLVELIPEVEQALTTIRPGTAVRVHPPPESSRQQRR